VYWGGSVGSLEFQGQTLFSDWTQNVIAFAIGLSFH
jgi:hypothetical protein